MHKCIAILVGVSALASVSYARIGDSEETDERTFNSRLGEEVPSRRPPDKIVYYEDRNFYQVDVGYIANQAKIIVYTKERPFIDYDFNKILYHNTPQGGRWENLGSDNDTWQLDNLVAFYDKYTKVPYFGICEKSSFLYKEFVERKRKRAAEKPVTPAVAETAKDGVSHATEKEPKAGSTVGKAEPVKEAELPLLGRVKPGMGHGQVESLWGKPIDEQMWQMKIERTATYRVGNWECRIQYMRDRALSFVFNKVGLHALTDADVQEVLSSRARGNWSSQDSNSWISPDGNERASRGKDDRCFLLVMPVDGGYSLTR